MNHSFDANCRYIKFWHPVFAHTCLAGISLIGFSSSWRCWWWPWLCSGDNEGGGQGRGADHELQARYMLILSLRRQQETTAYEDKSLFCPSKGNKKLQSMCKHEIWHSDHLALCPLRSQAWDTRISNKYLSVICPVKTSPGQHLVSCIIELWKKN